MTTAPAFVVRVNYAIANYAAYTFHEDPGAANHAARLNRALKSQAWPVGLRLCSRPSSRDANVVSNGSAVTDTDLQTATETAANAMIGTPISYTDLRNLAVDPGFLRRMAVAVAHFSSYILNESPSTPNHPAR